MKKVLIIMAVMLTSYSCNKDGFTDDELSIEKTPYVGNQLRIDGYYSCKFGDVYRIYFLYHDGTVLSGGDILEDKLHEQEQRFY